MNGQPPAASAEPPVATSPGVAWLVLGLIVMAGLSLVAAQAPPRIRLIGLFSIGFGLLVGWLLRLIADMQVAQPSHRAIGIAACVLTGCGLVAVTWQNYRREAASFSADPQQVLAARMMEEMQAQSKEGITTTAGVVTKVTFQSYLVQRIRQLGHWSSPWPEAVWCAELVAGMLASWWMAVRGKAISATSPDPRGGVQS